MVTGKNCKANYTKIKNENIAEINNDLIWFEKIIKYSIKLNLAKKMIILEKAQPI